jgi:hypothetical protein
VTAVDAEGSVRVGIGVATGEGEGRTRRAATTTSDTDLDTRDVVLGLVDVRAVDTYGLGSVVLFLR